MNVFFGPATLILTENRDESIEQSYAAEQIASMGISSLLHKLENSSGSPRVNIFGKTIAKPLEILQKQMVYLEAGGGLVQNPKQEILFIYRMGYWDLPKGKPEKNESMEATAIREVEEECGVSGLSLLAPLPSTWHIYRLGNGEFALKQSYWFHMHCQNWEGLKLQTEEDITDARWESIPVAQNILDNAYLSIRELITYFQQQH